MPDRVLIPQPPFSSAIDPTVQWWVTGFMAVATLLHFDTYTYYGWQPLVVLKFPLWWGPVNSLIAMIAGAVVLRFEAYLTQGWRQVVIIPVTLTVSAAGNTIAGWPSWFVINTDVGPAWTPVGGLATFVLSAWFMSMVVESVAQTAPVRETADAGWIPQARSAP